MALEGQICDITAFLKGMQAQMDSQHETLKSTLDSNAAALQDLSNWKPKVQAEVEELQVGIRDLRTKFELSVKQSQWKEPNHKIYDTEEIDLTASSSKHSAGTNHGPLGHGNALQHRGDGNGVVTTLIPTPVTCAKPSDPSSLQLSFRTSHMLEMRGDSI